MNHAFHGPLAPAPDFATRGRPSGPKGVAAPVNDGGAIVGAGAVVDHPEPASVDGGWTGASGSTAATAEAPRNFCLGEGVMRVEPSGP